MAPALNNPVTAASDWSRWPNFSAHEMRCKGSGKVIIHSRFMDALQALRTAVGAPLVITSGCRSADHNQRVGGHPRSLHICDEAQHDGQIGTLAVDAAAGDGIFRGALIALAWQRGWSIGWGRGFVHLDRRDFVGLRQTTFDYY